MVHRTTIRMDAALLARAKQLGRDTDRTLTAVIEDAVREAVRNPRRRGQPHVPDLPTYGGSGLQPGVDLENNALLLDIMDGLVDPD